MRGEKSGRHVRVRPRWPSRADVENGTRAMGSSRPGSLPRQAQSALPGGGASRVVSVRAQCVAGISVQPARAGSVSTCRSSGLLGRNAFVASGMPGRQESASFLTPQVVSDLPPVHGRRAGKGRSEVSARMGRAMPPPVSTSGPLGGGAGRGNPPSLVTRPGRRRRLAKAVGRGVTSTSAGLISGCRRLGALRAAGSVPLALRNSPAAAGSASPARGAGPRKRRGRSRRRDLIRVQPAAAPRESSSDVSCTVQGGKRGRFGHGSGRRSRAQPAVRPGSARCRRPCWLAR